MHRYRRRRRFGICMPTYREGKHTELFVFLCLHRSFFRDRGAVFSGDIHNRRRRFWWIHASGTGGEARCTIVFCVSAVELSQSGGAKGSGFRWISTLGGCAFGMCMPACREGERGLNFVFALAPLIFFGTGGGVFYGSLQSAAALLGDTCQRDGRGGAVHSSLLRFRR